MSKRKDPRPICYCPAYSFPHKADSKKCKGQAFTEFYLHNIGNLCSECNCHDTTTYNECDVANGKESIQEAECYRERVSQHPSEQLPLKFIEEE